jgi:prepilin-type N-terminal cleavage/methylation domain-containing protein
MNISIGNGHTKLTRRADAQPLAENARGGFSLVELLMVLCVLVVLTSMSLPATLRWQRGMAMEQAISMLQIQIQETRLAAIRSGEPWSLVLPMPGTAGRRHPTHEPAAHAARSKFQWPAGVQCHDMQTQQLPEPVLFRPDGTVSGRLLRLADSNGHHTFLQIDRLTGSASVRQNPSPAASSDRTLGKSSPQQNGAQRISRGPVLHRSSHVETGALSC